MSSTIVALRSDLARLDGPSWQAADAGEPESTGSRSELIFEIRGPVAAIGDQAQLLRDRVANGGTCWTAISEGLQDIEQTVTRVSRLLCELAETHAPGAGPGEALRRASTDLVQFARSVGAKSDAIDDGPTAVHLARGERPISELPGGPPTIECPRGRLGGPCCSSGRRPVLAPRDTRRGGVAGDQGSPGRPR